MATIKLKRGKKASMPTLAEGEPAYTTDEGKVYIGNGSSNIELARADAIKEYSAAGNSLGLVKSGGDVTILSGVIKVDNATKATKDGDGNTITNTYATKTELNSGDIDCGTF